MTFRELQGWRGTRVLAIFAVAAVIPLVALIVSVSPLLVLLPVLALGLLLVAFEAPVAAAGLVLLLHVAAPVYLKAPMPGGLYSPPISTTLLLALCSVGVLAYLARAPLPPPLGRDGRRVVLALSAFAAIVALSLTDSKVEAKSVETWASMFLFPGLVCAMLLCVCRGPADIRRVSVYLMAGGVLASGYAVVEYALGRNPLLEAFLADTDIDYWSRDELGGMVYRCFSVYGNPLQFGMVVGMIFPFAAVRTATAEQPRERLVFGAVMCILAIGVLLSFSRGPLLALIIGSLVIATLCRGFRPWLAAGAVAAAAMALLVWSSMGHGIADRIGDVDNMTLRLKLWQTALAIFGENPFRGIGIGNFYNYYLDEIRENHIGPFYEFGPDRITEIHVAENTYLQLAAETGLLGLVTGAVAVLAMLCLCWSLGKKSLDPRSRHLAVAIGASAVIYLVNGLFITAYTFYFSTLLFLGFLPGALLVLDRAEATRVADARTKPR